MDDFTRTVFLSELRRQCAFALAAYAAFKNGGDPQTIFYHIQSFLVSSANVSKILFPGGIRGTQDFKDRCNQRADELRNLLSVDEDSDLSNRDLRDHFEHFDERIQTWGDRPGPKNFIDSNVMVGMSLEQAINVTGASPQDYFRLFVTPPPTVRFWGTDYPLQPIATALQDLMQKIPQ